MKKIIIFGLIAFSAVALPLINVAQAASRPWCYFIPPFNDCSSNNSSASSVSTYRDTSSDTIIWPSPIPYPDPTPTLIAYNGATGRPPVWQYTGNKTVYANQVLQFPVNATDADGDYLYYDILSTPAGAWFAANGHTFYWTPDNSQVGAYTLTFSVSDGSSIVYQNVYVTVLQNGNQNPNTNPNPNPQPPVTNSTTPTWSQTGDKVATVGQYLQFQVYAYSDSGTVSYAVLNVPSGARFDSASRLFSWNPDLSQVGNYIVTFRAFNAYGFTDMIVAIRVVTANPVPAPIPTPTPTPTPAPAPVPVAPTEARITFSNIKVENKNGDAVISWDTNIPATDRVIWDITSEATRTSGYTYANATPDNTNLSTNHLVNLGKLDVGTTYYLRLVSKTALQTRVSQEIAFVQVPEGQSQDLFGASLISIFGKLFSNTGFLWLMIIGLGTFATIFYRKHKKSSVTL